jgi:FMN phosphatase YigB (HAD superfamily)
VVISDDCGKRKPHPELFEKALRTLNVEPQHVLMVGDSPLADIEGARQVGLETAWIQREERLWPTQYALPTYTLGDLTEILKIPGLLT